MKVGSIGYHPNYATQNTRKNAKAENKANTSEINTSESPRPLTREEKTENFTNHMLDRYKKYGLTVSMGNVPGKKGVSPSFSIHPNMLKEAANDPEKAKELDSLMHNLTTVGQNYFNAMNNPPDVKASLSVHVNADGSRTIIGGREYSSQEARNKHHASFNINSFLEEQEELLKKDNKTSNFDYLDAIRTDFIESYREEAKRAEEASQEYSEEQQDLLEEQQKKSMLDLKI